MAVKFSVDKDYATMVVDHVVVFINHLRFLAAQLQQAAADPVAGRHVKITLAVNRRRDHGHRAREIRRPHGFAILRIHPNHFFGEELHQLLFPFMGDQDRGGILGLFLDTGAAPEDLPGLFVQSSHGALPPPGGADDLVAIDQHRFGISPVLQLPAEILDQIGLPQNFSILGRQTAQHAVRRQGIKPVAIHRRRGTRAISPIVRIDLVIQLDRPLLRTGLGVKADHMLPAILRSHRKKLVPHHRKTGITQSCVLEDPFLLRTLGRPRIQDRLVRRMIIAVGPAPLRPIGCAEKSLSEGKQNDGQSEFHRKWNDDSETRWA